MQTTNTNTNQQEELKDIETKTFECVKKETQNANKDRKIELWINRDNYLIYLEQIKSYASKQRLNNYGYEWKDFLKMSKHKSQMNKAPIKDKKFYGIYERFHLINGTLHYCTGQSQNEEMLTVLSCLTGLNRARWF